ncbi:bifunctional methylenetetrahydrofolate dehydrogenase/methenyltetrahydrofolate cyclohydrolase [Candidatus Shapirobacteria bacterium CG09_land_8_20_14_0_10_38_17]|uniref:Bifunctional protein FolD n=1 Tax=Candidatus Shapirobacteria bacterium CG09_land_8_20_14_0_10_38_17 TaxID=1974884 RepID=A0A2H0WTA1_9BACT|nr:MAG: bifunctional methylenetetrahydrofolate dehydrogenase/methenyltetrahydrofolate cyclohydrolase [Candidatus Shapirobacteria bacterium CG09_land_8_20_14_0_10_38_17]
MVMVFDGKKFVEDKEKFLQQEFKKLVKKGDVLKLVSILVGQNQNSRLYISLKEKIAIRLGIVFEKREFPEDVNVRELIDFIKSKNNDFGVKGIMVQLPLPAAFDNEIVTILREIDSQKDVDCLTPENLGLLMMGRPWVLPATVRGIWEILGKAGINRKTIIGKNVCILGRSDIVGKPLANLLINLGATVTVCHRQTGDLVKKTKAADILISATGQPDLIRGEMVKKEAVVIDVGSPRGDVNFRSVASKASFITPVPGGVGPVTVVSLLENFLDLALQRAMG